MVLLTDPKLPLARFVSARPNCGVLKRLKASARNCAEMRSLYRNRFISAKSEMRAQSKRKLGNQRGAEPTVNGAGAVNAAVLNHRSGTRFATPRSFRLAMFGRCTPNP